MALSLGNRLPSLQQYDAPNEGYLSLKPGEEVTIEYIGGSDDPDWLYGNSGEQRGWFPKVCVLNAPRSPPPPLPPPPPPAPIEVPMEVPAAVSATPAAAAMASLEDDVLELLIQDELSRRPKLKSKIIALAIAWRRADGISKTIEDKTLQNGTNGSKEELPKEPLTPVPSKRVAPRPESTIKVTKEATEPASVKRTFCKFWQENKCTKGDACTFAHGDDEIGQPILEPEPRQTKSGDGSRKKLLCKFWQEGKCSKGPGCTFAHGDHELGQPIDGELARLFASRRSDLCSIVGNKSTPCKFWQEGKCAKGDTCSFQHVGPTPAG